MKVLTPRARRVVLLVLAVLAASSACSPKLTGAPCVTDTNCPIEQTCQLAPGALAGGTCQTRPSCQEDCKAKNLVCGLSTGSPACECPPAAFVDGGLELLVSTSGSEATASPKPNGAATPSACNFVTLSDALDLANAVGALDAGFGVVVDAAQNTNVTFRNERFPLTIGNGVLLQGSQSPGFVSIASLRSRGLVRLLPGGRIDSFRLGPILALNGEPVVTVDCPAPGGPSGMSHILVSQQGALLDGGVDPNADAGANTGIEVRSSCALVASDLGLATEGIGLWQSGAGSSVTLESSGVQGKYAALKLTNGTFSGDRVALVSPTVGVDIEPQGAVGFNFSDGGVVAATGITVGGDGGTATLSMSLSALLVSGDGLHVFSGKTSLDNTYVLAADGGVPPATGAIGILADGPGTTLSLNAVQVSGFTSLSQKQGFGLVVQNGASATLNGGKLDHNDIALEALTGAGVDVAGTSLEAVNYEGVLVQSGAHAQLHGAKVSAVDGGVRSVGLEVSKGTLSVDGASSVSGFTLYGLSAQGSNVHLRGDSAAAPVAFSGSGLFVFDSAVDATFSSVQGAATLVQLYASGDGGVGQLVSFQQSVFTGVSNPKAVAVNANPGFLVTGAYPLSDGGASFVAKDCRFEGGQRGLQLGNTTAAPVMFAAVTDSDFSNFDDAALYLNASPGAGPSLPTSAVTLDGNSFHASNVTGFAAGGLVLAGGQPATFVFQRNKLYNNRVAQIGFDASAYGVWTLESAATQASCAAANQIACYSPGQGLVTPAAGNGVAVFIRNASWLVSPPKSGLDYTVPTTSPSSVQASPSCFATTQGCN